MKNLKKLLALLLTVSMLTGLLGTAAFAAETTPVAEPENQEEVVPGTVEKEEASSGETGAENAANALPAPAAVEPEPEQTEAQKLQAAIDAATDGEETTITMTADIEDMTSAEIITIPAGKVIVLDMAGHSITVTESFAGRPIANKGTLTVTGNGTIDSSASRSGYGAIRNDGTLTIENGTYIGNVYGDGAAIRNGIGSTLTVNDGYFAATGAIYNVGKATIYKGEFVALACSGCGTPWAYALNNRDENGASGKMDILPEQDEDVKVHGTQGALASVGGAEVYVQGGTFYTEPCANNHTGSTFYALYVSGKAGMPAKCVVDGGIFSTTGGNACVYVENNNASDNGGEPGKGILEIHGGTFDQGDKAKLFVFNKNYGSQLAIDGGTFSDDVTEYVVPSAIYDSETGTVNARTADDEGTVAEAGGKYYTSLRDAINAVTADQTVTLLEDVTTDAAIIVGKNLTLDLGGKTLTTTNAGTTGAITVAGGKTTVSNGKIVSPFIGVYVQNPGNFELAADAEILLNGTGNGTGIFIRNFSQLGNVGTVVTVRGRISGSPNSAIQGNGNDKDVIGTINIESTAYLEGGNVAIYHPENSTLNINGGTIIGKGGSAIATKAGELNITGGTIQCTGEYKAPTAPFGNGALASGAAIQIETNTAYAGNIKVNISGDAKIISDNGNAIYQYGKENEISQLTSVKIAGGTFSSGNGVATVVTEKAAVTNKLFAITGGTFSTDVDEYCTDTSMAKLVDEDGRYHVVSRPTPSVLTTDIGEKTFLAGKPVEFTFTTEANSDADRMVIGTSNFSNADAIEKLEYYETKDNDWHELPVGTAFGDPATGFPMSNATSKFRVTFKTAGAYTFTASMKLVGSDKVLCSTEVAFNVYAADSVAVIGSTGYPTLQDAFVAATAGQTVTLVKDITVDSTAKANQATINIPAQVTLDGGNHTITAGSFAKSAHMLGVINADGVKIMNLTVDMAKAQNSKHALNVYGAGASLTLENVTLKNANTAGMVVNLGTVNADQLTTENNGWGGINVDKGGKFTATGLTSAAEPTMVWSEDYGTDDGSTVEIAGFETVYGVSDGKVHFMTVEKAEEVTVAKIGEVRYGTLQAAINAAVDGQTVALLNDTTEAVTVPAGKNITLDLNGQTLTSGDALNAGRTNKFAITVASGADLTVAGEGNVSGVICAVKNEGTMTITGGSFTGKQNEGVRNAGTMTITGGSFTGTGSFDGVLNTGDAISLQISGGSFKPNVNVTYLVPGVATVLEDGWYVVRSMGSVEALNQGGTVSGNTVTYGEGTTLRFTAEGNDLGRTPNHWWAGIKVNAPEGASTSATYQVKEPWAADFRTKNWSENTDGTFWAPADQAYIDRFGGDAKALTYTYRFDWNGDDAYEQTVTVTISNGIELDMAGVVAEAGSLYFGTLQAAVDAAGNGEVTLLESATESITVPAGKSITLNIPENVTLTNAAGKHTITNNGTLTVTGAGTVDNVSHKCAAILNKGTATLAGGTYSRSAEAGTATDNNGGNSYYTIDNQGAMTIQASATVMASESNSGKYSSLIRNLGAANDAAKGVLTISGGTFNGGLNTVKNDDYGILSIAGGTFSNTAQHVVMNWNKATISGGTFIATTPATAAVWNGAWESAGVGELNISGGTFTGSPAVLNSDEYAGGTVAITGGTYSNDVNEYCAAGYVAPKTQADGTYTVTARGTASELTTNIGEKNFVVGNAVEFTFTTTANGDAGVMVLGTSDFSDEEAIEKLEYKAGEQWLEYPRGGDFGPSTGFPMSDATSTFRVTFAKAGEHTFTASMKTVAGGKTLCSTEVEFEVHEAVAKIGDTNYESLGAAAAAQTAEQTITLLRETTLTEALTLNGPLTLNADLRLDTGAKLALNGTVSGDGKLLLTSVGGEAPLTSKKPIKNSVAAGIAVTEGVEIIETPVNGGYSYQLNAPVAQVGDVIYASLQEAIDAADNQTVTLLAGVELDDTATIPAGKTLTLDLGTYTLSAASGKNVLRSAGDLTITNGTVSAQGSNAMAVNATAGSVTLAADASLTGAYGLYSVGADLTVNGSINASKTALTLGDASAQVNAGATLRSGSLNATIELANGQLTVTGGEIRGGTGLKADADSSLTVTGGSFYNMGDRYFNDFQAATCTITGGSFASDVADKLGEGYLTVLNGSMYTVTQGTLTIGQSSASLYPNDTVTLTVTPANAAGLTWTSSNPVVATVNNGIVTAVAVGEATITATISNGSSVSCTVTVQNRPTPVIPGGGPTGGDTEIEDPDVPLAGVLPFEDVEETDWFYNGVYNVYFKDLMVGVSDTLFDPQGAITRGMIVSILYRLEGSPAVSGDAGFDDVPAGQWYTDGVTWAASHKIVEGYGDGTFQPNKSITREEFAAILYRYAGYKGYDTAVEESATLNFTDAEDVSQYAVKALLWAVKHEMLNGMGDGTLAARGGATRAQAALIFTDFCSQFVDEAEEK